MKTKVAFLLLWVGAAAVTPAWSADGRAAPPAKPVLPLSFDQLDANGDGYLTADEVRGTSIERRFAAMDLDHDGRVSRREYLGALGLKAEGPSTFDVLDANHDGVLSRDEASADPPLARQFTATDSDRNGFLDRSEFSAFEAMRGAAQEVVRP